MKTVPTLPPTQNLGGTTCSAMERRAVGGTENQVNALQQQCWLEEKNSQR